MGTHRSTPLTGPALAAVIALTGVGATACGGSDDDNPLAPDLESEVPNIRASDDPGDVYRGLLDAAFREDLEAYAEQEVTVLGDVADVLSPRAFTLTSADGSDVEPVLVITSAEADDIDPDAGETIVVAATTIQDLDPEAVVEELDLELDEGDLDEWEDDTYLLATIVEAAE